MNERYNHLTQVVTTSAPFRSIDLYTVQVADLTFTSDFEITATRTDYIHALICYFDIDFAACHTKVHFGTGPADKYTHWKQTVFYLHNHLTVNEGDTVKGTFSLAPHTGNHRDLEIEITYKHEGEHASDEVKAHQYKMC
jgi:type I protein arginine methyltransferase